MVFVRPGVVEILNFDSFGLRKSCGEGGGDGSQAYTLRQTGRTLIWGSHRPQHEGQTLSH